MSAYFTIQPLLNKNKAHASSIATDVHLRQHQHMPAGEKGLLL
jgi:hypothetical protein